MTIPALLEAARTAWWLRACERVGEQPRLHGRPSVTVDGGTIRLGARCFLSSQPVTSHFVAGPGAVLEIGDDVSIGHGAAVAAFERVEIGGGTRIGPFIIIMDTNFHGASGDQSVQHECRPVAIGRDCRIGSRVTITRGISIGDGAEVLAGSVVSSAIPAGACAGGARARVLGRAGDPAARWDSAAALLPLLLMDAFGLGVPPDVDTIVSDIPGWDASDLRPLVAAIDAHLHVVIDHSNVVSASRVGDVAAVVEEARRRQSDSERHDG